MSLNRIARRALLFLICGLLFVPTLASGATEFYVDEARTTSGDGSAANPWKYRSDIDWPRITSLLASGSVSLYFSSRSSWTLPQWIHIPESANANGDASHQLTLDGQSRYNLVTSGVAVWQTETDPNNRALFKAAIGDSAGPILMQNNNSFINIRGFHYINPSDAGVVLGEVNPTVNIHDILIENLIVDTPQSGHGIWFGYAEAGCYNVTVRNNRIIRSPLEGIYIGHYNYLANTITGIVVEGNTLVDTGTVGEGDIDIKAGAFGAIVRYNESYSTGAGHVLGGVVLGASDAQVYGNYLHDLSSFAPPNDGLDSGNGIEITADGDGTTGKAIANLLIYNNVIVNNAQGGIRMFSTKAGTSSFTNIKILNNTIVANGQQGFAESAGPSSPIAIAKFQNNLLSNNSGGAMSIGNAANGYAFGSLDYNLYFGSGTLFQVQQVGQSFAQWQALGFDAHGLNADPQLDASFRPTAGSPMIDSAITEPEFTTDKAGTVRPQGASWDIGAYEGAATTAPSPPTNVRIVGGLW